MKRKGTKDLTLTQRREIENHLKSGCTKKRIAELLGVCLATVYNELKRGQCTQKIYTYTDYWGERHYKQVTAYSADIAEYKYRQNQSAHGAPLKIGNDFELVREIENRVINDKISPCAALGRIKREKACRTMISKTTLYRYIRAGYIFTRITMNGKQFHKLFKSITVDNGVEFSDFKGLEKSIYGGKRTSVYYCHPYSSCERGSNERLNREIRRLIPKGTDLSTISDKRIKAVETWVNDYPREIFGYATSAELFAEQLQAI